MRSWVRYAGVMVLSTVTYGCGGSGSTGVDKWMGATRHLRVVGTIMGEAVDVDISGATANDTTQLWCEREYQVPNDLSGMPDYAHGHNAEVRVKGRTVVNGEMRLLDIGFKRHDWQLEPAGAVVPVIPRDDANSPCGLSVGCTNANFWLSWTWRNPTDNSVIYKSAAQSGNATLGQYVGTPDATGLMVAANTGDVGAYATGQWSATDSVQVSFDASCTKNTVDNSY
jgi:hypothetical protein